MLNITNTKGFITKIENKGKYRTATFTTSKKDKDDKWIKMFWNARLVGKATELILVDGARIELTNAVVENVKVNDKYYTNLIVFELNIVEQGKNKAETTVIAENNDVLPF